MYRLIIRRDARTPHCYRVTTSYAINSDTHAPVAWSNSSHFGKRLYLISLTQKRPGTICNPRKILAEYQAAKRGRHGQTI